MYSLSIDDCAPACPMEFQIEDGSNAACFATVRGSRIWSPIGTRPVLSRASWNDLLMEACALAKFLLKTVSRGNYLFLLMWAVSSPLFRTITINTENLKSFWVSLIFQPR